MIEKMIAEVKQCLPLKIAEVTWDGTQFHMFDLAWNFTTLSSWRVSKLGKVLFGCFDSDSVEAVKSLLNVDIVGIEIQDNILKIDPIFVLSNDLRLEIFSTDTYEPWTFKVNGLAMYIATPSEPTAFSV